MKRLNLILPALVLLAACTSGSEYEQRNKDIFDEAKGATYPAFSTTPIAFNGSISTLVTTVNALAASGTADSPIADAPIEGIVSIPSDYGFATGTNGCTAVNTVFARSFVLNDSSSGILVAYGQEPPVQDIAKNTSMKYISNARTANMAVFGDRIRLTATRAQKYGSGANTIPVITDFKNIQIISSRNSVGYVKQTAALVRATDLYQVRQIEGYVTTSPSFVECVSGEAREFQFNFQTGYKGTICVGATSVTDAQTCTGLKVPIRFQLSKNLGAGTLSGFDTGDMFSYTIAKDAKVRLTGPVFPPEYNQTDANLLIMLSQKLQVETLR
ncbi:hypothetical protein [Turneriella parva]|uniref:Lipoprotein n=1 Tax=Turneriella parva (strain ATCC BAA-1111 / DSM 21527 / NCTC 11395 / H) TaxID=869212 RepID=I4B9D7_TURPD|nr:hypothetical protein [Turneriella parva]AFM13894.1 hypothetical protein Turpa_3255 [Turneriella parva DSM 21527]